MHKLQKSMHPPPANRGLPQPSGGAERAAPVEKGIQREPPAPAKRSRSRSRKSSAAWEKT